VTLVEKSPPIARMWSKICWGPATIGGLEQFFIEDCDGIDREVVEDMEIFFPLNPQGIKKCAIFSDIHFTVTVSLP
jgi:hypothetical protein